jgi:hypothetical protein
MRIKCKFNALVVGKKSNVSAKNGQTYYQLAIATNGEAGNIGCTQEIYEAVEEMKAYNFEAEFNSQSQWNPFYLTTVIK